MKNIIVSASYINAFKHPRTIQSIQFEKSITNLAKNVDIMKVLINPILAEWKRMKELRKNNPEIEGKI